MNTFPAICPSCAHGLHVRRLECKDCGTAVEGSFELPLLVRLSLSEQAFVIQFVLMGGNLKALAKHYNVSYPTVRNRLDALIDRMKELGAETGEKEG